MGGYRGLGLRVLNGTCGEREVGCRSQGSGHTVGEFKCKSREVVTGRRAGVGAVVGHLASGGAGTGDEYFGSDGQLKIRAPV